jgi:dethiobiotin synthetase
MRWFITGTDTDVGKTVATACLAQSARKRGSVIAAKPVASGVAGGTLGEDALLISEAAGHAPLCHATYGPAVSPHRAILMGGKALNAPALAHWIQRLQGDSVLVEGVGGWRVPLQVGASPIQVNDLARWTDGRIIVVARDRLGTLNHTLLTVEAIHREGFDVAGVVLCRIPGETPPPSNLDDLGMLLTVPVALLPVINPTSASAREAAGDALWQALSAG